jgi:hypothetical protein
VPGLTDWEYYFHGVGCCLTRRADGEAIDVDFHDGSAEYFDLFFYRNFLRSLRQPEPPEARLIALHPSWDALELDYWDLQQTSALELIEGRGPCRLSDEARQHVGAVEEFCGLWAESNRRPWLAARVGDWSAARTEAEAVGAAALAELSAERMVEERRRRRRRLAAAFEDSDRKRSALAALDDLGVDNLPQFLHRALRGPPSGTTSAAMAIVCRQNDPAWCPEVWALLQRLDPSGQVPHSYLYTECLGFLLGHGYHRAKLAKALYKTGGAGIGDAALLALEYIPEAALLLLRRALRSKVPANRDKAAAVLALIDRPWSRHELLAVLRESDDQERTADARVALLETRDPESHRAVQEWERRNPHEQEPGPWITGSEMMLRNRPAFVRYEMQELHDRVMKVRDKEPTDPSAAKPWWKFWVR